MEDWLSKDPIMAFEPKVHEGRWIPGLEIYSEEEFPDGWAAKNSSYTTGQTMAAIRWSDLRR